MPSPMATACPVYFLPSCLPSYSSLPREDEETVEYNRRQAPSPSPQGTIVRKWSQATVILKDQGSDARLATYGRLGVVSGEVEVTHPTKVFEIKIKFEGSINVSCSDSGELSKTLFSNSMTLWSRDRDKEERCPTLLPFVMQFPASYEHEGKVWRIPPSFEATFLGIPALFARCTYTLSIMISKARQFRLALWSMSNSYTLLLNYRPRTRPYRPILHSSLFSSIKAVPEEWLQLSLTAPTREKSELSPIDCHLFIPSSKTYCIAEPIPFHLQLCGSLKSLRELLPPSCALLDPDILASREHKYAMDQRTGTSAIRIYIARQVGVNIHGRRRFRTCTIGTGKLQPVPPLISQRSDTDDEVTVDWNGELRCWSEVTTGGFGVSSLTVKVFTFVIALTPTHGRSPLLPAQLSHSIRLVTDP